MDRGDVAKFIGDGLLALFGALEPNPWQANDAVHAALAIRAALSDYNAGLVGAGRPALAMGVGIDHGVAVIGVMGSGDVMEYGVIGNTVKLAARFETLTHVKASTCWSPTPRGRCSIGASGCCRCRRSR